MGIIKDPKSWRTGFELGLAGFSFPYSKPRKPTAYLYNGIRLPALPEWDRGVYPYAVIVNLNGGDTYYLFICDSEITCSAGTNHVYYGKLMGDRFQVKDGAWVSWGSGYSPSGCDTLWANHDIYDANGTFVLSASDPAPIYE